MEVLRALVKEGGASVEVRDADGRTPLLWAASAGSAAAVLALHQAGAKVDDADRYCDRLRLGRSAEMTSPRQGMLLYLPTYKYFSFLLLIFYRYILYLSNCALYYTGMGSQPYIALQLEATPKH